MITVFTPLHFIGNQYFVGQQYIEAAYDSLLAQSHQDWQWLILENNGGRVPERIQKDARVQILYFSDPDRPAETRPNYVATAAFTGAPAGRVGALKGTLCLHAILRNGADHLVELDADDLLDPVALELILRAFKGGADFVYSDFAEFRAEPDGWKPNVYSEAYGWEQYPVLYQDHQLLAMVAPEVTPQNLRFVDWAPNHVRAWTKEAYLKVGGHNPELAVADDHDLIVRMYLAGCKFHHIERCLYYYRVHGANTVGTRNAEIRRGTNQVYERNIWKLAEKFADDHLWDGQELQKIDLCGAIDPYPGYRVLDRAYPAEEKVGKGYFQCNLDKDWPLADNSVGVLRAHDAIEHLKDPIHTMNEAWRVLAPGGFFMIHVPSTNGVGAWCDPTHVSFWNEQSFRYYTSKQFARYIPAFVGKFQVSRIIEWFPSEEHKQMNMPYVEAHLICLKEGYKPMGAVNW